MSKKKFKVQNSKQLKFLFQKLFFLITNILRNFFSQHKKKSFLFFNIRNTRFDQTSPVQPNPETKNLENSLKKKKFKT